MKSLRKAFDYQKFAGNRRLDNMIRETESRYSRMQEMNEDDLFFVNAAGTGITKTEDLDKKPLF